MRNSAPQPKHLENVLQHLDKVRQKDWLGEAPKMKALVKTMARVPKQRLSPVVLLLTLTAIYVQETRVDAEWFTIALACLVLGCAWWVCRRCPS